MLRVSDVLAVLEDISPARWAFSFDKVGLQIGDPAKPVTKICFSLDSSLAAARYAAETRSQLLISHHPLLFHPLDHLRPGSHVQNTVLELVRSDIAFIAAHTNWDCAPGGINDALSDLIGLQPVKQFGLSNPEPQFKLVTFAPEAAVPQIAKALADAGAGIIGDYSQCTFQSSGSGTFLPGDSANPQTGQRGALNRVPEVRLETLCPAHAVSAVKRALIDSHPYEEPAFDLVMLQDSPGQPGGRLGRLPTPLSAVALQSHVDAKLDCRSQMWTPESSGPIEKVAVVGGAAAGEWRAARSAGAQAFVTGEVPQHLALEAAEAGLVILAAGHYHTEQPGVSALAKRLRSLTNLDCIVFEPEPGQSGRPI